jgi:hypothetical protein
MAGAGAQISVVRSQSKDTHSSPCLQLGPPRFTVAWQVLLTESQYQSPNRVSRHTQETGNMPERAIPWESTAPHSAGL